METQQDNNYKHFLPDSLAKDLKNLWSGPKMLAIYLILFFGQDGR